MKKRWHVTKPVLLSAAGKSAEEVWDNILRGRQDYFQKNSNGYFVARYRKDVPDVLDSLVNDSVEALREPARAVLGKVSPERVAVVLGNCDYYSQLAVDCRKTGKAYDISFLSPHKITDTIASALGFKGPCFTVATACASGATAIARAIDLLEAGYADVVLAGGIDTSSDIIVEGFASLSAVSPEHTNPFSRNRNGITLGDGAGYFFVSKERLADFPVVITGFGERSDGYNMTGPDPAAGAVTECLEAALSMAGLRAEDIDYINLHGTGTKANDSMEGLAVSRVFPAGTAVSSTKAVTGHTLAAAGAIELGLCALAIAGDGFLPPHVYDGETEDEASGLSFVRVGERKQIKRALSSSFAFGGADAAVIMEREDA